MSYKQPSSSNGIQVPSWDEFNLAQEEVNLNGASDRAFGNDQHEVGLIYEPGHSEEFGPNLPPGFVVDDSKHDDANSIGIGCEGANDDFSIPIENYDLDDPEDPLQGGMSAQKKPSTLANNQSTVLPKVAYQKNDEHCSLPSLGVSSSHLADFVPIDQRPCSSSTITQCDKERAVGPTLPPEFVSLNSQPFEEYDIGTALPPDEPQCSIGLGKKRLDGVNTHRKLRSSSNIGPTLPSSSDEEEEEEQAKENNDIEERVGICGSVEMQEEGGGEEGDEGMVGPMPPTPGKTEEEEQAEYLGRLAQFELNKHTQSNELRREEWMTELPQKMIKTGAFGLTAKTSFSRQSSDRSLQQSDLWTNVPNGKVAKPPAEVGSAVKRPEKEQLDQQRADELNKERNESLLEMHQKKRRIDTAQSSSSSLIATESGERRPFDRDREIEGRCFRGKSGVSEGSGEMKERMGGDLSSRFGHANDRKFL